MESAEDGVYSVTTQTRYNAEGAALNSTQKHHQDAAQKRMLHRPIPQDVGLLKLLLQKKKDAKRLRKLFESETWK